MAGNWFAYAMLFSWPLVTAAIFARFRPDVATAASLMAGYLLLPSKVSVDLPLLPPIDKPNVIVLSTLLMCMLWGSVTRGRGAGLLIPSLILLFVLTPIGTSLINDYELRIGGFSYPAFTLVDGLKTALRNLIQVSAFLIGFRFLSSPEGRATLLKALIIAGVLYSVPIFFEARFSPQLHRWVYGFYPGAFHEALRWGGFRPTVFLQHGLQVAVFMTLSLLAACVAVRARWKFMNVPAWMIVAYLIVALIFCKTLGAAVYAAVLVPVLLLLKPRSWMTVASALLLIVCTYPLLRSSGLIPIETIMSSAESISGDRAESLSTRLTNEEKLLAKANDKPLFGWGGWGRNRVFDAASGQDVSITDGGWIIQLGVWGWFGYAALFGLLTYPVLRARMSTARKDDADAIIAAGLTILLAVNLIDMLPNENLSPITFLIAGSIAGFPTARKSADSAKLETSENRTGRRLRRPRPGRTGDSGEAWNPAREGIR